jgi:DNA helicase-2/ATP-dependent DNA helicase PcrA
VASDGPLEQISKHIRDGKSFMIEAGAGSGKTYSLVHTVKELLRELGSKLERQERRIVCITYTNVAKDEIVERLQKDARVEVDTIHEFLWHVISLFQRELRDEVLIINAGLKAPIEGLTETLANTRITYGQYGRKFDKGELHHDDVITIARALFEKYPKIVRIAADRYPYIFVDEYQDTDVKVIELLLDYFVKVEQSPVIGLFGDTMQQIYDSKVSDVAANYSLEVVTKLENYRCSKAVINVINRLRTDIQQIPGGDNKDGNVHLLTTDEPKGAAEKAIAHLVGKGWDPSQTKVLMLTHRGIAREAGFADLMAAYSLRSFGNEALLERTDEFGELFTFVENLRETYRSKRYGAFLSLLGKSGIRISTPGDKQEITDTMASLEEIASNGTVQAVVNHLEASTLITAPPRIRKLVSRIAQSPIEGGDSFERRRKSYEAILLVFWSEISKFVSYADSRTPYSTKHSVKGAEYENVLVVVDDSLWNKYKFAQVYSGDASNAERQNRSNKLLYVCFSRAMNGLAVLNVSRLSGIELAGAQRLLGVERVDHLG